MKGEELKQWREAQGQSQKELAERLDVSRHSIIKWEHERQIPKIVELAVSALDKDSSAPLMAGRPSTAEEISFSRERLDKVLMRASEPDR